jgi:hypothetical protein
MVLDAIRPIVLQVTQALLISDLTGPVDDMGNINQFSPGCELVGLLRERG